MSKATQDLLAQIHNAVGKGLLTKITDTMEVEDEEGNVKLYQTATPADFQAAIKFLKDNSVTADIEEDPNLQGLEQALGNKQKKGRRIHLASVSPIANDG